MILKRKILKEVTHIPRLEVVSIFLSDQKFNHNPESNEDIHWTHIEPKNRPLKPLADHRAADLFWCGPD